MILVLSRHHRISSRFQMMPTAATLPRVPARIGVSTLRLTSPPHHLPLAHPAARHIILFEPGIPDASSGELQKHVV